jgi:hypothetical protein
MNQKDNTRKALAPTLRDRAQREEQTSDKNEHVYDHRKSLVPSNIRKVHWVNYSSSDDESDLDSDDEHEANNSFRTILKTFEQIKNRGTNTHKDDFEINYSHIYASA